SHPGWSTVDAGFIDLDILLTRIRHAQSKVYFLDAVKPTAEKAGASFMDVRRVRCKHCDRLILEETQHGPIHGRLPLRQCPNCGVGTPIPGRPLSLSRLPQASWGPFSRFRGVPSGCGDDRWRNTRLRRAVFLSPLRLVHFRTHRRRNRSEPRIPGCPGPTDANLRKLDRPSRVLVAAVSAQDTIRARSRRHGLL